MAWFWWRAFGGLLVIQVAQSLTLVLAVRIFFCQDGRFLIGVAPSGQLVNLILALCLLIILVRIPSWISRRIFIQGGQGSTLTRIVKYAVISKLTTPVRRAMHLRGGGGSGGRGRGRGGVGRTATRAVAGRVVATAVGGPAGTATATALTAGSSARGAGQAATAAGAQSRPRPASATAAPQPDESTFVYFSSYSYRGPYSGYADAFCRGGRHHCLGGGGGRDPRGQPRHHSRLVAGLRDRRDDRRGPAGGPGERWQA
ncbi:hypothetical protein AB0I81_09080 [Nonomuraea sp. NPDC050404]|uniref:hypothetical protein n=1 Tax=Nonomuraea sp. NPDC050404 TaxID=3155783 RepID=UPI0033FDC0F7